MLTSRKRKRRMLRRRLRFRLVTNHLQWTTSKPKNTTRPYNNLARSIIPCQEVFA